MSLRAFVSAMIAAFALGGCALLTAERPLLDASDASRRFEIPAGVWRAVDPECDGAKGDEPSSCSDLMTIESLGGGLYRVPPLEPGTSDDSTYLVRVTPASGGRLFVGEALTEGENASPNYIVIEPIGRGPPFRALRMSIIGCDDILRKGKFPKGVTGTTEESGRVSGCVAQNKSGLKRAARRQAEADRKRGREDGTVLEFVGDAAP